MAETSESPVYYAEALDLIADELDKLAPENLEDRRAKLVAVIRMGAHDRRRAEQENAKLKEPRHPTALMDWMTGDTATKRDAAFLRLYADKVRAGTELTWDIPNTRAATLSDIADRLTAAEQGATALKAWRPIETAPKDATAILALHVGNVIRTGHQMRVCWRHKSGSEYYESIGAPDLLFKPTHWMPLPAAPQEQP